VGGAGGQVIFRGSHGLREGEARDAQKEKEFAGPEQDIEQAAALEIAQVFRLEADVESFSGAFLDEGAHGGDVEGFGVELAAAGINALELFVTAEQKVVQAESLVIQRCNCGAATRTHLADSLPMQRIHSTQAHWFNPTADLILTQTFSCI
jgi:hypothetical protein